ncbi:universal stress protein [Streptomyces sp. HNM0574]|uniref:universal stress protein n=1 Tax=Streptomyces sp. HNM0574 TaxID=2714954 RepID=UPI00146D37AA|nr:universal stress protein [Streptomyces sp. HNM0574]NLU70613.1 universal stress protein [Streptomyces sp. HNM0574]
MSDQSGGTGRTNRVVVGIDGSKQAQTALDRAVLEARARKAELEVLCGAGWPKRSAVPVTETDTEWLRRAAAEVVDAAVARVRERAPELDVFPRVESKSGAADALVEASRTAALTVVGTRGHGGFAGLLVGSVSLRAAAHCQGPLMVVGGERSVEEATARGTVLVGVRSPAETETVRFGFDEAQRTGSTLRVLHAWSRPPMPPNIPVPPSEDAGARQAATELVRAAVAPLREQYPDVRVKGREQSGPPAATLIEATRAADLVVLTTPRRRQRRLGLQLGPVVHAVLHHAHCPVVLVPAD